MQESRTITRRSASNLALAFVLLPKHKRDGMSALYAFCREVDDVADNETVPVEQRRQSLNSWRTDIARACSGERPERRVNQELQPFIVQHKLPFGLFDELIRGVEMDLVQTMAAARWRLRRISTIETTLLNNEMTSRAKECRRELHCPDDDARLAWVFQKLAGNGQSLALLMRYEGTLNRSYDRAFKQLHVLQSARHRAQPNEPKPDLDLTPVALDSMRKRRACPPPHSVKACVISRPRSAR